MNVGRWAGIGATLLGLVCRASPVEAYRPFDGTDASVADLRQIEIELGPVEYLRSGGQRTLFAPSAVINYGFAPNWEATVEGRVAHTLAGNGAGLTDPAALLKGVLREGGLQDKPGPSVAGEFGVLLPGIGDDHGTGTIVTGIVSQRWNWATIHLNVGAALTRQQHANLLLDVIFEGPPAWPVRPVAELFGDRDFGGQTTRSALIGAIWQAKEDVAVDFGVRGALAGDHTEGEIRLGVTFAFALPK